MESSILRVLSFITILFKKLAICRNKLLSLFYAAVSYSTHRNSVALKMDASISCPIGSFTRERVLQL